MTSRARPIPLLVAALLLLTPCGALAGWSAAERAEAARGGRAAPELVAALDAGEEVSVIVALAKPRASDPGRRARERAERADAVLGRLAPDDFRLARRYGSVSAFAGRVTRRGLLRLLASDEVVAVDIDRRVTAQLAEAVPLVSLSQLHLEGHTGVGQVVAVIDTGVNASHEDLVGEVVGEQCFCYGEELDDDIGCCPNGMETQSGPGAGDDDNNHGTRVGSIVTSNGTSAPLGGAPDADLVSVKVLDQTGGGHFSDVIAGLDWLLESSPETTVVNLSLGGGGYPGHCDDDNATNMAIADVVRGLRARGVPVFAGSGNSGSSSNLISPACVRDVISVSAIWDEALGSQTWLSCTEPNTQPDLYTCFGNSNATLDIVAPGAVIEASRRLGGSQEKAGTSYATPIGAACAAVMLAAAPGITPGRMLAAMKTSTVRVTDPDNDISFPRLDCAQALAALPQVIPATPWPGAAWPVAAWLLISGFAAVRVFRRV